MSAKSGNHGDVVYRFEDNGFKEPEADTEFKVFGGNATLDTYEGSHEAVRVFNADRYAAEVVEQVFDGAWSVSGQLGAEPPWWFQAVWGSPTVTEVDGDLHEFEYALDSGGDPETLKLYLPTEGFGQYEVLHGCTVASVTIDQSHPNNPEFTVTGAYAAEPERDDTESIGIPSFTKSTFTNRMADLEVGGTRVAKAQGQQIEIQTGTELIGEIGSGDMVDFVPRGFEPSVTHDKIVAEGQDVDMLDRFKSAESVTLRQVFDNGGGGEDEYRVELAVSGGFPNSWSESGRNDPDADLMEELQEMGETASAKIIVDESEVPT